MRLTVNDASAAPALLAALRDADCLAAHAGPNTLDVQFRSVGSADEVRRALTDLVFFVRAWEAVHPGLRVSLVPS